MPGPYNSPHEERVFWRETNDELKRQKELEEYSQLLQQPASFRKMVKMASMAGALRAGGATAPVPSQSVPVDTSNIPQDNTGSMTSLGWLPRSEGTLPIKPERSQSLPSLVATNLLRQPLKLQLESEEPSVGGGSETDQVTDTFNPWFQYTGPTGYVPRENTALTQALALVNAPDVETQRQYALERQRAQDRDTALGLMSAWVGPSMEDTTKHFFQKARFADRPVELGDWGIASHGMAVPDESRRVKSLLDAAKTQSDQDILAAGVAEKRAEAAREAYDQRLQDYQSLQNEYNSAARNLEDVGNARDNIRRLVESMAHNYIPVVGQMTKGVWGTNANEASQWIGTIKASLQIGALQELKRLSSTGASGLGNTTRYELEQLSLQVSALDLSIGPQRVLEEVNRIYNRYARVVSDIDIALRNPHAMPPKVNRR